MRHCGGIDGRPEVWVTMSTMVICRPLKEGTLVPGGRSFASESPSAISPRAIISARRAAVIVLVTEPISNAMRASKGRAVFGFAQT
jgi:hypothetical protein